MKKEATIVIDTFFTFNGRRVLLEAIPVGSDRVLEKEIEGFRNEFWGTINYWDSSQKKPEIIDQRYLEEKEG